MSDYSDDEEYDYGSDEMVEVCVSCDPFAASLTDPTQDDDTDYDVPSTKGKGKERDGNIEYRTLSLEALQDQVSKDITRVASVTGLEVHAFILVL